MITECCGSNGRIVEDLDSLHVQPRGVRKVE